MSAERDAVEAEEQLDRMLVELLDRIEELMAEVRLRVEPKATDDGE